MSKKERIYVATDIEYDTDGEKVKLPKKIAIPIPDHIEENEDAIMDYISDEISNITGYCHNGFEAEKNLINS